MFQAWLSMLIMLTQTLVNGDPCSLVLYHGHCERQKVEKIPQHLPANITFLDLNENCLESVGAADLRRYRELDTLLISKNQLKAVADQAFFHLTQLAYLDLSYNKLRNVTNVIFRNNTKLTEVILTGNKFSLEPASPFLISTSITHLELRDCSIQKISSVTFSEMTKLIYIDLSRNQIRNLDSATFQSTELIDLYIDSPSGIENTLIKLCKGGTSVHLGNRLTSFCKENMPFWNLADTDNTSVDQTKMMILESTLTKLNSSVIVTSPTPSLNRMEMKAFLQETQTTLKELRSYSSSSITVLLSSPVVSPVKVNVTKLDSSTLEMSDTNLKNTFTVSLDLEFQIFIVSLLLTLFCSLILLQWLRYRSKLKKNRERVLQFVLQNMASGAATGPVRERLSLMDAEDVQNDGYEIARGNAQHVPQLSWPSAFAPERPLPSPPGPSRPCLVSYHEYEMVEHP